MFNVKRYFSYGFIASALGLTAACGGSEGAWEPDPNTGEKKVAVTFEIVGKPLISSWKCDMTVDVSPGSYSGESFPTETFKTFSLPEGDYSADIEVSCDCPSDSCKDVWVPSVDMYGGLTGNRVTIPGKLAYGWKATERFKIRDSNFVANSIQSSSRSAKSLSTYTSTVSAQSVTTASSGVAHIEFELVDFQPIQPDEAVLCDLHHYKGYHGGFGYHSVSLTNDGSHTVDGWNAYIDFGDATPTNIQWVQNGEATISGNGITIHGDEVLAPGESVTFGIGGQYNGANEIDVACY